jgi:hypothetical protein
MRFVTLSLLLLPALFFISADSDSQIPPKQSAPQKPAERSAFSCPDAAAQPACKSYQELLKAKDTSLPADKAYICFRRRDDEFFVIYISQPSFLKYWDKELQQVVTDDSPSPGWGLAQAYKGGILDSRLMPYLNFAGQWRLLPLSESEFFVSQEINFKGQDKNDKDVGVTVDEHRVNLGFKYENPLGKTTQYTLTIQRATERFAESFLQEAEKVPLESAGYCVYR